MRPQDSDKSKSRVAQGGLYSARASEPPLEFVMAPKRADAKRRFAYIGAGVIGALMIGYLFGASPSLSSLVAGAPPDVVELPQSPPARQEAKTDAADRQQLAKLISAVDALQAQIEQLRRSVADMRGPERLRALEAAREQSADAAKTEATLIAKLDKVEARLGQLERAALDRPPTAPPTKPDSSAVARSSHERRPEIELPPPPQKAPSSPAVIADFILDGVDGGKAFVKRPDGFLQAVGPGDELPGAGRVTSIERRAGGWIVTTTHGAVLQRP